MHWVQSMKMPLKIFILILITTTQEHNMLTQTPTQMIEKTVIANDGDSDDLKGNSCNNGSENNIVENN